MPEYRLYIFDTRERMSRVATLACESDADAIKAAEKRRGAPRMELWRGGKLIKAFPAGGG
jgi:hypothetical protein